MKQFHTSGQGTASDQIAVLKSILLQIALAERPSELWVMKRVVLERLAELEEEAAPLVSAES